MSTWATIASHSRRRRKLHPTVVTIVECPAISDLGWRLIIGTGAYGSLPIMPQVLEEAGRRGVDLAASPTEDACRLIASLDRREVHAVLHVTC
jgi:hypothetical protein